MLRTAVIAAIIFIVVAIIAIRLLALRHRYAAMCKLHRAPLQVALLCFALLLVLNLFLRWHWHCVASFHLFHLLVNARDCIDLEGG